MSKKFTEEQYQNIVSAWEETYDYVLSVKNVIETVESFGEVYELQIGEALALANAVSTEWAHERFVEKEKKYVWRDKYTGYVIYKMLNDWSLSATALGEKHFTETELENSPFKPEWFDKEEVD